MIGVDPLAHLSRIGSSLEIHWW